MTTSLGLTERAGMRPLRKDPGQAPAMGERSVASPVLALVVAVVGAAALAVAWAVPAGAVTTTSSRSAPGTGRGLSPNPPEPQSSTGSGYPRYWYAIFNKTPYTMSLVEEDVWTDTDYGRDPVGWWNPPDPIIGPQGESAFQPHEEGIYWTQITLQYDFTDINGAKHAVLFQVDNSGNPHVQSMDYNSAGSTTYESTAYFHVTSDADGDPHDFDAVLNHPVEVTIDATKDPDKASSAIGGFITATNKSFTVTAGPTYDDTGWSRASAIVVNASDQPASLQLTLGDTHEESTSIGIELTWSQEASILDIVDLELSASVTGGHAWSVTDAGSEAYTMTIPAGKEGWFEDKVGQATITGNFNFTTPQGIIYHVLNATVTEPGQAPTGQPPLTYRPAYGPIGPSPIGPSSH